MGSRSVSVIGAFHALLLRGRSVADAVCRLAQEIELAGTRRRSARIVAVGSSTHHVAVPGHPVELLGPDPGAYPAGAADRRGILTNRAGVRGTPDRCRTRAHFRSRAM